MIKYVGFIKEYENIQEAISFTDAKTIRTSPNDHTDPILAYLENNPLVSGWMGYFKDLEDKKSIAPHSYYTDGEWIWPSYFSYYITKYSNFYIDETFLNYLIQNNFKPVKHITDEQLKEIDKILTLKLRSIG